MLVFFDFLFLLPDHALNAVDEQLDCLIQFGIYLMDDFGLAPLEMDLTLDLVSLWFFDDEYRQVYDVLLCIVYTFQLFFNELASSITDVVVDAPNL